MTNEKFQIHINNASVFLEQEDEDAAIKELDQALALAPNHAEAMLMRADAKRLRKFFADALADYEKASELGADPLRTNLGWGETLVTRLDELGADLVTGLEFDKALARFDVAINSNPDCAEAHYWRARCLLERNELEAAIGGFQRSLDLNIDLGLFQSAKDFLKIASRRMNPPEEVDFVGTGPHYSDLFEAAHPKARLLLPESFFWTNDDFGPIGGDNGVAIIEVFWPWRVKNPKASVTKFMYDLLDHWLDSCVAEIDSIANSNVDLCTVEICTSEDLYARALYRSNSRIANVYDDSVITLAYGQFMVDGYLDAGLRERALQAIERQSAASVLKYRSNRMEHPEGNPDYAEARRKIKEGLLRMPTSP